MPRGYPTLNSKQKEEIISRVKNNGESVSDLAKEYKTYSKTIYNLLKNQVNQPNLALELSMVKKERDILLQIVGEFYLDQKKSKISNRKNF